MSGSVATRFALFGLGFFSISTQIYLIREFISVFYGNEFVFGIALANWMILTAAGAWLGRYFLNLRGAFPFMIFLMLLFSLLPTLMIIKLSFLRVLLFPYGSMASIWQLFYSTLLVQLPFCLLSGSLFAALSATGAVQSGREFLPVAYTVESWGSLAAGLLVNFILLWFFDTCQALLILTFLFLVSVSLFTWLLQRRKWFLGTILSGLVILCVLAATDPGALSGTLLFPDQRVVAHEGTPYGQVVVTENEGQLNFYENGMLLFSSGNVIRDEENVHFAMVQHPEPKRVLMVSGGLSGAIAEILKYRPARVDYVEMNPSLIRLSRRFIPSEGNPVVATHMTDARKFIRNAKGVFDVILVNLPEPSTLQINRFYTVEFFREVRERMNVRSILSVSLPTTSDYVSRQAGALNSGLYNSLRSLFRHVVIVPAGKNFFLASDSPLSVDIPDLVARNGIATLYVNGYYLDGGQMKERSEYVMKHIDRGAPLNHDFRPVSYYDSMQFRLSYFDGQSWLPVLLLAMVLVLLLFSLHPVRAGLFTGGFTGASMEVMLLLSIQILFGYLFQVAGIVITLFMLGLAAGSGIRKRPTPMSLTTEMLGLQILLSLLSVFIPVLLILLSRPGTPDLLLLVSVALMVLMVSFLVGREYRTASLMDRDHPAKTGSGNYAAELAGSAFGALIVTIYLIPVAGFLTTGIVLAVVNLFTATLLLLKGKNRLSLYNR